MDNRPWPRWAWFCSRCGVKNLPRMVDCKECRQAFLGHLASNAAAVQCAGCEARNAGSADYCEACGKPLPPLGERRTVLPATTGPVEGLYMGRHVHLWDAERRRTRPKE
jgi:LSD1 subclass zinc finger protein